MKVIKDIREKQDELIAMINATFDEIVSEVEKIKGSQYDYEKEYESIYAVTNTKIFKGKKVIAVSINGKREIARTWKNAVEIILKEVMKEDKMKDKIMSLRDKLLGRVRNRISATDENMRSPKKLDDDLYIETHYDTETLMNLLLQILEEIKYDYNQVKIIVKN